MNAIEQLPSLAESCSAPFTFDSQLLDLEAWVCCRDYRGYEPYDLLNSRHFGAWARHQPFATLILQTGKRFAGNATREFLHIPASRNPKALGLILAAYSDLTRSGWNCESRANHLKHLLIELRSPDEGSFCWGYDWHYQSLRGATLPAFAPNSIATVFCAQSLLDHAETFHDVEARNMAFSAAEWLAFDLQRSVDEKEELCFSYTPNDRTRIFNNSALVAAFLARVDLLRPLAAYGDLASRAMRFLVNHQHSDGSWPYGLGRTQGWIDSFHTGYDLCALLDYIRATKDRTLLPSLNRGYTFWKNNFFREDGAPRYFHDRTYPIDIHACSQAVLTFAAFRDLDPEALSRAFQVAKWTIEHLHNPDGSFAFQLHRLHTNRTPYLRWAQAWMLRALAQLRLICHAPVQTKNLD